MPPKRISSSSAPVARVAYAAMDIRCAARMTQDRYEWCRRRVRYSLHDFCANAASAPQSTVRCRVGMDTFVNRAKMMPTLEGLRHAVPFDGSEGAGRFS
jgi:hypothetical protein